LVKYKFRKRSIFKIKEFIFRSNGKSIYSKYKEPSDILLIELLFIIVKIKMATHFDLNVYIFDIRLKYVFYLNERDLYLVRLCREVKKNQIKIYLISLRVFSTSVPNIPSIFSAIEIESHYSRHLN